MPMAPNSSSVGIVGAASEPPTSRFASLNANASVVPGSIAGAVCEGTKPSGVYMSFVVLRSPLKDRRFRDAMGSGRELDAPMASAPQLRERERDGKNAEGACCKDCIRVRMFRDQACERDAYRLADEKAKRELRDGGAALFRRHLRRVGLQRVVQHVKTRSHHEHGKRCQRPALRCVD